MFVLLQGTGTGFPERLYEYFLEIFKSLLDVVLGNWLQVTVLWAAWSRQSPDMPANFDHSVTDTLQVDLGIWNYHRTMGTGFQPIKYLVSQASVSFLINLMLDHMTIQHRIEHCQMIIFLSVLTPYLNNYSSCLMKTIG